MKTRYFVHTGNTLITAVKRPDTCAHLLGDGWSEIDKTKFDAYIVLDFLFAYCGE